MYLMVFGNTSNPLPFIVRGHMTKQGAIEDLKEHFDMTVETNTYLQEKHNVTSEYKPERASMVTPDAYWGWKVIEIKPEKD